MSTTIYRLNEMGELVPVGKNKHKRAHSDTHKSIIRSDFQDFDNDIHFSYPLVESEPVTFIYPTYRFKAETVLEVLENVLFDPHVKWNIDQIKNAFVERLNAIITAREGEKALTQLGACWTERRPDLERS